jgi:hypothetical protein
MQVAANVHSFFAICKSKSLLNSVLANVTMCSFMHVEVKMRGQTILTTHCTRYNPLGSHFHLVALLLTLSEKCVCLQIDVIKSVQHVLASSPLKIMWSCTYPWWLRLVYSKGGHGCRLSLHIGASQCVCLTRHYQKPNCELKVLTNQPTLILFSKVNRSSDHLNEKPEVFLPFPHYH